MAFGHSAINPRDNLLSFSAVNTPRKTVCNCLHTLLYSHEKGDQFLLLPLLPSSRLYSAGRVLPGWVPIIMSLENDDWFQKGSRFLFLPSFRETFQLLLAIRVGLQKDWHNWEYTLNRKGFIMFFLFIYLFFLNMFKIF